MSSEPITVLNPSKHSIAAYVQVIHTKNEFRSAGRALKGLRQTPRDVAVTVSKSFVRSKLTTASYLAFAMDEPDYVVYYYDTPVMWHATTRGIKHRKDRSAHEWVSAEWEHGSEAVGWLQFYLRLFTEIRTALNDRLVASRR